VADVVYRFRAVGAREVAAAYESIGKAREKSQRGRSTPGGPSSDPMVKAEREAAKAAEAERRRQFKVDRDHAKALQMLERDKERARRRVESDKRRDEAKAIREQSASRRQQEQVDKAHARALQDIEKDKDRSRRRTEAERRRDEAKARRDQDASRRQQYRVDKDHARALQQLEKDNAREALRNRAANMRRVRSSNDIAEGIAGRAGSGIYRAMGAIGAAAAVAGVGLTGAAARDAFSLQGLTRTLSTQSRGAGQSFVSPEQLAREFSATATATPGQKASDLAQAASVYVGKTGDLDAARRFSRTFATVASASGGQVQDIASMAASIGEKFGIKKDSDMKDALASIYFQGKSGSFELKDAASLYDKLTAAGAGFGLDRGVSGVRTLGGLTQIARGSTGSSEQAAFAVEASLRQMIAKSDEIKKETGVDVFTDKSKTKARDVQTVTKDIIAGSGGNLQTLQKIYGEEGIRGVRGLVNAYNTAQNAAGPNATDAERTAAGMRAMDEVFQRAIGSGTTFAEVQKDAAFQQQDVAAMASAAWEGFVGDMAPAVARFANTLRDNSGALSRAFEYITGAAITAADAITSMADFALSKFGTEDERLGVSQSQKQRQLDVVNAKIAEAEKGGGPLAPTNPLVMRAAALESEITGIQGKRAALAPEAVAGLSEADYAAGLAKRSAGGASGLGVAADVISAIANPAAAVLNPARVAAAGFVGTMPSQDQVSFAQARAVGGGTGGAASSQELQVQAVNSALRGLVDAFARASSDLNTNKRGGLLGN